MLFTTQFKIALALIATVLAIFASVWSFANSRGARARGRRRVKEDAKKERRSDFRTLTGAEKRLYKESQRLLAQGRIAPAARVLEQLNMHREAIQALEDAGMIHEAAKTLLRMQRHNRAGVIYARHDMWNDAAQCFKLAGMPAEVAKCARLAGDLPTAAEYFEKAGRIEEAADCWTQAGQHQRAARLYTTAGDTARAFDAWSRAAATADNVAAIELEDNELQRLVDMLGEGQVDMGIAKLVAHRSRLPEAIQTLVGKGFVKQAAALYQVALTDIGPLLIAEVNYQNRSAANLGEMFGVVGAYHYAGMVYERMSSFDLAGDAFEKAEDFDRAAYCYERGGLGAQARQAKARAKEAGPRGNRGGGKHPSAPKGGGNFALAAIGTSMNDTNAGEAGGSTSTESRPSSEFGPPDDTGSEERTAVIDVNRPTAIRSPAPPPPPPRSRAVTAEDEQESTSSDEDGPRDGGDTLRSSPPDNLRGGTISTETLEDGDRGGENRGGDTLRNDDSSARRRAAIDSAMPPPPPPRARPSGPAAPLEAKSGNFRMADDDEGEAENTSNNRPVERGTAPSAQPSAVIPMPPPTSQAPAALASTTSPQDAQAALDSFESGHRAFHHAKFFADLDFDQKEKLWTIGTTLTFKANENLLTYNDEPRGIYVIIEGSVNCYKLVNEREQYVDEMHESESFGELWLLADQPTAVRFVAGSAAKVRVVGRDAFNELLDKDGTIARKLYKRFTMRLLKRLIKPHNPKQNQQAS